MGDEEKSKQQLVHELSELRRRVAELEMEASAASTLPGTTDDPPSDLAYRQAFARGFRAILAATEELLRCPDRDAIYRRAVELAREKLGVERCAVFVEGSTHVRGTYGTDGRGNTTPEHELVMAGCDYYDVAFQALEPGYRGWSTQVGERYYWDGQKRVTLGHGWIATTLIRAAGQPLGVFVNDTAITETPPDDAQQDLVALYCSLLGTIIERKRAEEAQALSRRHTAALADASPVGIWHVDLGGNIVYVNPVMCDLLEVDSAEELRGQSQSTFLDHDAFDTTSTGDVISPEDLSSTYEAELILKTGRRRRVIVSDSPLLGTDGRLAGYVASFVPVPGQSSSTGTTHESQMHEAPVSRWLGDSEYQPPPVEPFLRPAGGNGPDESI